MIQEKILSIFKKILRPFSGTQITRFWIGRVAFKSLILFFKVFNIFGVIGEHKIFLGSEIGFKLFLLGERHLFEMEIFKKQIKKGDVVLDLGAHLGYYTLTAAKIVGQDGKVFSFEPDPNNFTILEKNIRVNGYKNVIAIKKAVSNKTGFCKLYLDKNDSSRHTLYNDSQNNRQWVEAESVKLDDFFRDYNGKIDFIKMDIEGAESWAFQGMTSILEKNKKLKIFTEFNPLLLKKSGIGPEEYLRSIIKLGFRIYQMEEQIKEIRPVSIDELIKNYTGENFSNILCLR